MSSQRFASLGAAGHAARKIRGALLPVPASPAMGYQGRGKIVGIPGTVRIPAPAPFPHAENEPTSLAQTGWIGLPSAWFSWWTPSIYYTHNVWRPHMSYFSDNQMPVPAVDPRGVPGRVMPGPIMLGNKQVSNPRVAPRYKEAYRGRRKR